jgi:hypothetical protein
MVDVDQKKMAAITGSDFPNPISTDNVDPEQQSKNKREERLKKAVTRFSSRRTLYQIALTIPSFVVELKYGIQYLNQCPIQPLINVFLIVHGCSSLVNGLVLLLSYLTAIHIKKSSTPSPRARCLFRISLIGQLVYLIFSVAWLVVGQVWVFGAQTNGFQSSNSTETATYCYSTVFWTGFAIIIVTYAIWLILIVFFGGRYLIKRYKSKQETATVVDERN